MSTAHPSGWGTRVVACCVLAIGAPAAADLTGTTLDITLEQTHPSFGYVLHVTHTYGTTSTIFDPLYPTLPIHITTPAGAAGYANSLVVDFSDNQYGDFIDETGTITIESLAEDVDPGALVLLNENGASIGVISGAGDALTGTWAVNDVLFAGSGTLLTVAWDSVPSGAVLPQPKMGAPVPDLAPDELTRFQDGLFAFNRPLLVLEGLGPVFNQSSCGSCHNNPVGGAGSQTVTRFGRSDKGLFDPLTPFGGSLLQSQAIDDACAETVPPEANVFSLRVTNGALGYGLIEAIPDADLFALERDPPGISGRAHIVEAIEDPGNSRVGRFGWKAQLPTVLSFSADASLNEMGLTNRLLPDDVDPNGIRPPRLASCDGVTDPEDGPHIGGGMDFIDRVTDFMRFLAAPPQTPRSGMQGEAIFTAIGCADCHTPAFVTADDPGLEDALRDKVIRPYGDFLLHDMGLEADFIEQGNATGRELRTPPLWGVRIRDPLWHDGRIAGGTFADRMGGAIGEHGSFGSEAVGVVAAWDALSSGDQALVIAFLDSLGRIEFDADGDDDVHLDDFVFFASCAGGGPYAPDDPCAINDIDQDGLVDGDDFASLLLVYGGPMSDCNANGVPDIVDVFEGTSLDEDGDGVPDECAGGCGADLDVSGDVGFADLLQVLSRWGPCGRCPEDLDGDGDVGFGDLIIVLSTWGPCA